MRTQWLWTCPYLNVLWKDFDIVSRVWQKVSFKPLRCFFLSGYDWLSPWAVHAAQVAHTVVVKKLCINHAHLGAGYPLTLPYLASTSMKAWCMHIKNTLDCSVSILHKRDVLLSPGLLYVVSAFLHDWLLRLYTSAFSKSYHMYTVLCSKTTN